jgi:hypothetical protein
VGYRCSAWRAASPGHAAYSSRARNDQSSSSPASSSALSRSARSASRLDWRPRSRRGCRMSRLRRHGPAGRTGTSPRSNGACGKLHRHSLSQCHPFDGRNVEAGLRPVRCDWSAGGPMSRRPRCFVEPGPAARHLHAGAGARYAAEAGVRAKSGSGKMIPFHIWVFCVHHRQRR